MLLTIFVLCLIPLTRYYQIDQPLIRRFRSARKVDPLALHAAGEFVENNLGTEFNSDGSVTLRMIAQQYLFVPHCVAIPTAVPVHLRITSADVVHSLAIEGTDYVVKIVPGAISQVTLEFPKPGIYKTVCREFCGAGHYDMRSEFRVLPKSAFPRMGSSDRGYCAAQ